MSMYFVIIIVVCCVVAFVAIDNNDDDDEPPCHRTAYTLSSLLSSANAQVLYNKDRQTKKAKY